MRTVVMHSHDASLGADPGAPHLPYEHSDEHYWRHDPEPTSIEALTPSALG